MSSALLILSSTHLELELSPCIGGSISRLSYLAAGEPRSILRECHTPLENVLDAASFPLVPFVNRVRDGSFSFRGRSVSLAPNMAGDHFLYAIAAVLLGMTMFVPGRPNILGTLVAALILKALGNGLILIGAAYYVQDIVLGLIIIGSVALSTSTITRATLIRSVSFKT